MELFAGKLKLDLSIWDITKSVIAVVALIYVINFMSKAENFFNTPKEKWDKTTIEMIATGVAKAQVAENNKILKDAIEALKETSKALQAAQANDETIKELGSAVARIEDNTISVKSDVKEFAGRPTATLAEANVDLLDADGNKYTIATARFSPDVPEGIDNWSFNTWPRTIHANVVLSEDEEGRPNRYLELYTKSDWEADPDKLQPLKIESLSWAKGEVKDKKFRFAPRLGASYLFGTETIVPALDYSFMSYGRTNRDMTWRFLDIGFGGNEDDLIVSLTPFSYNLGEMVPVIENLFVGPTVGILLDEQEYSYGLSLSIPL